MTRSVREGLWLPIFWVFRVKIDNSVRWAWAGCGFAAGEGSRGIGVLHLFSPSSSTLYRSRASSGLEDGLLRESV